MRGGREWDVFISLKVDLYDGEPKAAEIDEGWCNGGVGEEGFVEPKKLAASDPVCLFPPRCAMSP